MPRPGISYEETWIYLLRQRFPGIDIIDRPGRGSTSMRLYTEGGGGVDLLEMYNPDMVILQIGLTECAPRLFRKAGLESFIMKRLMPKKFIPRYVEHVKKTRGRNPEITEVSPEVFKRNIFSYAQRCRNAGTDLLIIKILEPTEIYIEKSPFIKQNIDLYNSIYKSAEKAFSNVSFLDPVGSENDVNLLCVDELHINQQGHLLYFDSIIPAAENIIHSSSEERGPNTDKGRF